MTEAAVERLDQSHFDCILLDLVMPRLGGAEALSEIRALRPKAPAVIMSGFDPQDDVRQVLESGAAFLHKPFHSGDLAVMHADGYIQIMDRKKDIIISGGENISTVEVESVIYSHPDVQEVAVIPVPDDKWGEVPKAFVVPKSGSEPSAEDIIEFTKSHLARFKAPKYVEFGELPKTATGKIQKVALREHVVWCQPPGEEDAQMLAEEKQARVLGRIWTG